MLLLFSDDVRFGGDIALRLRQDGLPVVSHDPDHALKICDKLDFSGVILDGRSHPKKFEALSESLFQAYPDLPIVFLVSPSATVFPCAATVIVDNGVDLFHQIQAFCRHCVGRENYTTYALQHLEETKEFTYLGYPLPLSDSEYRFLLCLFRRFPREESVGDLLSEAFPSSRISGNTLWTFAARINQASRKISGLRLIRCAYGKGYRLCDGVVKQAKP